MPVSSVPLVDDPHLKGEVRDVTEKQAHEYNRKTINMQLCNIFGNAGIDSAMLSKYNMTFSILDIFLKDVVGTRYMIYMQWILLHLWILKINLILCYQNQHTVA